MSDKTEKATHYKLQKAKEQGSVSKSNELTTSVFMLVLSGAGIALLPASLLHIRQLIRQLLSVTTRIPFSVDSITRLQQFLLTHLVILWLPFALAGIITIMVSTIAQTGFVWSGKPLAPEFKRINIASGFKRLFSSKMLFDAGKNSLKLTLVVLLMYISLKHELPTVMGFIKTRPDNWPSLLIKLFSRVTLQLSVLLLTVAMIDKLYTRWKFAKDNRMSKHELKEEYRQREGDPKIKAKIRQLQHQLRQKTASLEQIKTADVVITDSPQHAVALTYDRGVMPAPKVVCKAQGELVRQVQSLADRYHVPIIENQTLARLLFMTASLNQTINREHFPVVAAVFRDIYRQSK